MNVDQDALITLHKESLENPRSMQNLEESAAELYKALQAGRDTGKIKPGIARLLF